MRISAERERIFRWRGGRMVESQGRAAAARGREEEFLLTRARRRTLTRGG